MLYLKERHEPPPLYKSIRFFFFGNFRFLRLKQNNANWGISTLGRDYYVNGPFLRLKKKKHVEKQPFNSQEKQNKKRTKT